MAALPSPTSLSLRSILAGRSAGAGGSIGARDAATGRRRLPNTDGATGGRRTITGAGSGLATAGARRYTIESSLTARDSGRAGVWSRVAHADEGTSDGGIASRSTGTAVTGGGVTRSWKRETIRSNPATQTTAAMMPAVTAAAVMRRVNGSRRWRTRRRGLPRAFTERGRDSGSGSTAVAPQMSFTITLMSG